MNIPFILRPNKSITSRAWTALVAVELAVLFVGWSSGERYLIPGPGSVVSAWGRLVAEEGLLYELFQSMKVNVEALLLTMILSVPLAWATVLPVFRPVVGLLSKARFFGMAGFTIVFTLAFGGGHGLKVSLMTFGMSVFFITSMASVVAEVPRSEFDHARSLRMGEWRSVWEVVILGRASDAMEVLRQNAAIGWMMLTMVEGLVRSEGGIGALMLNQSKHFKLDAVFAIQLTVFAVGILQDYVIGWLKSVICPYAALTLERK